VRFSAARRKSRPPNFRAPKSDKECETKVWAGRPNRRAGRVRYPFLGRTPLACCPNCRAGFRACRLRSFPTSPTKADSLTRNPGTGKSPEPADRNVCPTSEAEIDLGNSGAPISDPARFCWNRNTRRAGGRRSGAVGGCARYRRNTSLSLLLICCCRSQLTAPWPRETPIWEVNKENRTDRLWALKNHPPRSNGLLISRGRRAS